MMATLYVRNFPDTLYETVQKLAGEQKLSIGAEVIALVTDAVERQQRLAQRAEATARIKSRRNQFRQPVDGKDTVTLLREDRER